MASQTTEAPDISPEEYGAFVQGIELRQVYLSDARVKRTRTPAPEAGLNFDQQASKSKYTNMDGGFSATLEFRVTLLEDDGGEPFGDIKVTYTAEYSSEQKMTKKIFEVFGSYNLLLNLYPYVREYVHTTTNRMGMPTLILPTLKTG